MNYFRKRRERQAKSNKPPLSLKNYGLKLFGLDKSE